MKISQRNYMQNSLLEQEPLFRTRPERLVVVPPDPEFVKYYDAYKKAVGSFWTVEEVTLDQDRTDWDKLDEDTKFLLENMLAFFSGADFIVNANLAENFMKKFSHIPEIGCFLGFQIAIENIHNEMYGQLIHTLIPKLSRRDELANAVHNLPNIQKLYNWAKSWVHITREQELQRNPLLDASNSVDVNERAEIWTEAKRLVAFACVEGIMFSGPFCVLFWIKEKGILPGLTFSNEQISTDEGMHTAFSCMLYNDIVNKPPEDQILDIVKQAVDAEKEFIGSCLDKLVGLNSDVMNQYIEFVADKILSMLGYKPHWNTPLPESLKFMEKISINGMANMFERLISDYSISGFEEQHDAGESLIEDF